MKINFEVEGRQYSADLSKGIDLSSQLGSAGAELRAWHVPEVKVTPVKGPGWVGRVSDGSPVNFFDIAFNPHGNGTHTECYGHISPEHQSLNHRLTSYHFVTEFLRLEPQLQGGDQVVTLADFKAKLPKVKAQAVIIAAGSFMAGHDFSGTNPVYFEAALLKHLKESGVEHFLTNLPSVDREEDGGKLLAHKAFWNYPEAPRESATISELLQIPDDLPEGKYLLNLQVAAFENDASPSRPVLYPLL